MAPFTISVPPLTAAQHGSLALSRSLPSPRAPLPPPAAPLPPAAPAPPTAPPSRALAPAAPAPPARASEERKKEEAKEKREGVWRILVGQRSAGAEEEDAYLVQLVERGKKVRVSGSESGMVEPESELGGEGRDWWCSEGEVPLGLQLQCEYRAQLIPCTPAAHSDRTRTPRSQPLRRLPQRLPTAFPSRAT